MKRSAVLLSCALAGAVLLAHTAAGMGKPRVAALQVGLQSKGLYGGTIDGVWGPRTARAVRRLQRRSHLAVDGVPGPRTRKALGRLGRHDYGSRVLRNGHVGWDVSQLQFRLAWHGFPSGSIDGGFGPRTQAAVRRFQRWSGLGVDGAPGQATYRALRRPGPRSPIGLKWPIGIGPTDGFGPRGNRFHTGLDFPAAYGARVRAAGRGRIVKAGWDRGGYGKVVIIRHPRRTYSWYAHLSRLSVRRGAWVTAGTPIARVGSTGHSTGPHLHFEVRVNGSPQNPRNFLP
jgi:peptidoglycan hydrolase-like protein with peptidoglycan-binding domain